MERSVRPDEVDSGAVLGRAVMGYAGLTLGVLGGLGAGAGIDEPGPLVAVIACLIGFGLVALAIRPMLRDVPAAGSSIVTDLADELDRARRHRRSLAIVKFSVPGSDDDAERMLAEMRPQLRSADRPHRVDAEVVVVLPDTDRAGASHFVERVVARSGQIARTDTVIFPDDAVTVGAMLAQLEGGRSVFGMPAQVAGAADAADSASNGVNPAA